MLLLTALIVMRFFDTDVGFLIRGLAFIAAGVGFLVVNIILLKRRKGAGMTAVRLAFWLALARGPTRRAGMDDRRARARACETGDS